MNSRNIRTIISNDFRRFWIIGALGFLFMFFGTNSALLLNYEDKADMVGAMLQLGNFNNIVASMALPVVAAAAIFRYLHQTASVAAVHSLPVSRAELFTGHMISGYILSIAPVILNSLVMAVVLNSELAAIIRVTLIVMLVMLVTYSVSVLAAMITGTTVMHVLAAFGLNFLPIALAAAAEYCADEFLLGYSHTSALSRFSEELLACIALQEPSTAEVIAHIVLAVAICALAFIAYRKRALEKATEPLAFRFTEPVVSGILTFFMGMAVAGYFGENGRFILGFIIGIVLFYFPVQMIIAKSTRVFNKRNAVNGLICAIISMAIIGGFYFDIGGYTKKVPDARDVASVETGCFGLVNYQADFGLTGDEAWDVRMESDEAIRLAIAIHEDCIEFGEPDEIEDLFYASVRYHLKSGRTMVRTYTLPGAFARNNDNIRKMYESPEFKDQYRMLNSRLFRDAEASKHIVAYLTSAKDEIEYNEIIINKAHDLAEVMDKDFADRKFKNSLGENYQSGMLASVRFESYEKNGGTAYYPPVFLRIMKDDYNTINWLKDNGYYDELMKS